MKTDKPALAEKPESSARAAVAEAEPQKTNPAATDGDKVADSISILSSVSLGDSFDTTIRTTKKSAGIPVAKPKPGIYFRTLPGEEYTFNALSIKEDDTGDIYILSRELADHMADEYLVRPRQFTLCVTSQGGLIVWPVSLPVDGQLDEYNKSALLIVEKAKEAWVRVVANRSVGSYEIYIAEGELGEPVVPSMSMEEIVATAFKDRVIDTVDHPVLKRLRGEH